MTRARTPPENAYFEELTPNSSNQGTNTNKQSVEEELDEGQDDVEESEDKIPEYDVEESEDKIPEYESESDVETTSGEENDEDSRQNHRCCSVSCWYFLQICEKYKTQ